MISSETKVYNISRRAMHSNGTLPYCSENLGKTTTLMASTANCWHQRCWPSKAPVSLPQANSNIPDIRIPWCFSNGITKLSRARSDRP